MIRSLVLLLRRRTLGLVAIAALVLAGCASTPPADQALPFEQAARSAGDALFAQSQRLPAFLAKIEASDRRGVVLDPSLDGGTGQQTAATLRLDAVLAERAARQATPIEVLPFEAGNLARARYLLVGTLTRGQPNFKLELALVDLQSGKVAAHSSAAALSVGIDMQPLPFYRDSPVLMKDKVSTGYVRTSGLAAGQPADPAYLERIAAATAINDANLLYDSARYREALVQYREALGAPGGEQIKALTGVYLSAAKLGRNTEAEEAFGRLMAYGIAFNSLNLKLLFSPGSTDFWPDPKLTGAYPMWLRQLARQSIAAKACMQIIGHTSKTGSEAANDTLSLKRAQAIRQRLSAEAPELARRTRAEGMGARQNIVGTGTDDLVDAPDRRVEFAVVDCAGI